MFFFIIFYMVHKSGFYLTRQLSSNGFASVSRDLLRKKEHQAENSKLLHLITVQVKS